MTENTPEWVNEQNQAWDDAIEAQRIAEASQAKLGFIGEIIFDCYCEDQHQDRRTSQMTFDVMVDWMRSCNDYFTEMINAGDYDGCEIFVNVYELTDTQRDFSFEFDAVIDQIIISV